MFALGCYANSFLTPDSKYWEFFLPQIIRGMSLMFCFIPTNNVALGTMPKDKVQNASGLYNLTRNLGGAIGLAAISTTLTAKTKIFSQYINENISSTSVSGMLQIEQFKQVLNGKVIDPEKGAYIMLNNIINRDAFIIAINEVFVIIGLLFIFGMLFLPFTANVKATSDEPSH
jgi:DHA2 family multidrug resistance protein